MAWIEDFGVSFTLCILLSVLFFFWRKGRATHYWRSKNVPCDTPLPFVGSYLRMFLGEPFFQLEQKWYKKHGRIYGAYGIGPPRLFVADPKHLSHILVKDFHVFSERVGYASTDAIVSNFLTTLTGDDWKRVRSIIAPAFSYLNLKKMIPEMIVSAEATTKAFLAEAGTENPIDSKRLFEESVIDSVARTAYGLELSSSSELREAFLRNARAVFEADLPLRVILTLFVPQMAKLLKVEHFKMNAMNFFAEASKDIVKKRTEHQLRRNDFLQLMLDKLSRSDLPSEESSPKENEDDEILNELVEDENYLFFKQNEKQSLTTTEFLAQCVFFFVVGFDTTSTTLAMLTYYLAQNPECQKRLQQEVDEVWKNKQEKMEKLSLSTLNELKYMERVIYETLRRAPPGARLERVAVQDYQLPGTDIMIQKGKVVCVPVYAIHHDPDFFPNPEKFDPDRFLPENKDRIQPYTYFPFGSGPRNCVGSRLALLQMKICLFYLFRSLTFQECPERTKLEFNQGVALFQPRSVAVNVIPREKVST